MTSFDLSETLPRTCIGRRTGGLGMSRVKAAGKGALHALGSVAFGLYGVWARLRGPLPGLPIADQVRRILVIRLDLLGDVVLSIPAIEALGAAFPQARVDLLVLPYTAPLVEGLTGVGVVLQLDVNAYRRVGGWRHVGQILATIHRLRRQRYDLAVGLSGLMGGVFAALSGARWRVGYEGETYRGCYNVPVPGRRYERPHHEVEYGLDLVRALGTRAPSRAPRVHRRALKHPPAGATFRVLRSKPDAPYAVLVPGASNGTAKRWPAPFWSQLGDRLAREGHLSILISGAASERALAEAVARGMATPAVNTAGETTVEGLVDLLAGAAVVVAGDTGPLHLAAALGTPVVGIYGPTDPANSSPLGASRAVVRLGLGCSPCYDLRSPAECKLPDRSVACMWGLHPDRVFQAACEVLAGRGHGMELTGE